MIRLLAIRRMIVERTIPRRTYEGPSTGRWDRRGRAMLATQMSLNESTAGVTLTVPCIGATGRMLEKTTS